MNASIIKAACDGWKVQPEKVDIHSAAFTSTDMNAPAINHIAESYSLTRQRLHQIRRQYDLSIGDLLDPEVVFERLLEQAPASRLRTRLSNPGTREAIKQSLTP